MVGSIAKHIGQYRRYAVITPLLITGEVLMELLIPYVTASIIDKGIQIGNIRNVLMYGAFMLAMALVSLLFGAKAGKTAAIASTGFASNLRDSLYRRIQDFSFSNIDKFSTAGLVTRMTTDVSSVQNAFQMIIRIAVRAPLMMVMSIAMCFTINARITWIFIGALLFLALAAVVLMRLVMPTFRKMFERYDDLNSTVQENVTSIRVVKAFVREDFEKERFGKAAYALYSLAVKAEGLMALISPIMHTVIYTSTLLLCWVGAHFIVIGSMTTGNLTSLYSYIMSMFMSLMMVMMVFVMMTMSLASAKRISEVLEERPDIINPENPVKEVKNGSVDFNHVSFSYRQGSGDNVLEDIDLHIRSGETVGVIGGTGSGKSTLVSLISRLYDAKDGNVEVGGVDVRDYDLKTLRDSVSVVLQKNVLFSGTILENLRWGNEDATEEECRRVCMLACADDFIEAMPDGYESTIEQGGSNVSGGQKQRLCIARALLKKPKVLILDDSTSAVDTATDARIRMAFRQSIPETTKIIISQRISSVKDADRILVLEDGMVNGFDTYGNLLRSNRIFKEIHDVQMQGSGDGDFDEKMN